MKTLDTIQKTCKIFKILAKVAMILSFVWAGLALLGAVCAIVWGTGSTVHGENMELIQYLTETSGLNQMLGAMLGDFVLALTDGILFLFAFRYFKSELADGTPFTMSGAARMKKLGIQTIVMPLVAVIIAAVIRSCFGVNQAGNLSDGASVVLGIALILFSLVLRHGAELRETANMEKPE